MTNKKTPNPVASGIADTFVRRSHQVVRMGYDLLSPHDLKTLEETEITGRLVDAIEEALDGDNVPRWSKHFWPGDDAPVTVGSKTGKNRPRVDITVVSRANRPTRKFRFEAKRLSSTHPMSDYLGTNGLLRLVTGHYGRVEWAGMIGYVQSETCSDWATKIKQAVTAAPKEYLATNPVIFAELGNGALKDIFHAAHEHKKQQCRITHTLLLAS